MVAAKKAMKHSKRVRVAEAQNTRKRTAFTPTRRVTSSERSVTLRTRVALLLQRSGAKRKETVRTAKEAKGSGNTCWNCGEIGHVPAQCPTKEVHAVHDVTTAGQTGQDTTVSTIGSYFDLGSVSEGILEPRGAGAEICSDGSPTRVCR